MKSQLSFCLLMTAALVAFAAGGNGRTGQGAASAPGPRSEAAPASASSGPSWSEISPAQQQALRPLQRSWDGLDAQGKRRWLGVAARFDGMSIEERALVQERMNEWARLSPRERNEARVNFRDAREMTVGDRRERWEAYKALPEDERRSLGARSAPAPADRRTDRDSAKNNTVPNPLLEPRRPGATTNAVTARPAPPLHQQPGLPKVAATPEFVNAQTLLPRRGAQAAAAGNPDKPVKTEP